MTKKNEQSFENSLAILEKIVQEMESGCLPLEENIKHFEQGMKLAALCEKKLNETEKKVELLVRGNDGKPQWQNFEESTQ